MTEGVKKGFGVNLGGLKKVERPEIPITVARELDAVGEARGFVARVPAGKRGRAASPRTGQVHAKVLPDVSAEISAEAARLGTTQGVVIEAAWKLYREQVLGLKG
jgi:hypothetical protein